MTAAVWCFTDLETTSTDHDATVLEVGFRTVTADLETIAEAAWVLPYPQAMVTRMYDHADDVVRDMHTQNGLWDDCVDAFHTRNGEGIGIVARWSVWDEVTDWLREHAKGIPLAGSSVHVDRRWLWNSIDIDDLMHYRIIDVSTVRQLAQQWAPRIALEAPTPAKRHRALPDLDDTLAELRYYRQALGLLPGGAA